MAETLEYQESQERSVQSLHSESLLDVEGNQQREAYFTTASGNMYALVEHPAAKGHMILLNRENLVKNFQSSESLQGLVMYPEELESASITAGEAFEYKNGKAWTTEVDKIAIVPTGASMQEAPTKAAFWQGFEGYQPKQSAESQAETAPPVSVDDERLLNIFLYPEKHEYFLYAELVGDAESKRRPWDPEKLAKAEEGMRLLIETEFAPINFVNPGIEGARADWKRLMSDTSESFVQTREQLKRAGRELDYQTDGSEAGLRRRGDFLHFGINYDYSARPDVLDSKERVYVTPKMEAIGRVAAEVISMARQKGYEPYGKVWDETMNQGNISPRQDRLLFYASTQSQLDLIMNSLRVISHNNPELFESDPVLLSQRTDIPGVGLAQEPNRGRRESFNRSREEILEEAHKKLLDDFMGQKRGDAIIGNMGVDRRDVELRQYVEQGRLPMQTVVDLFRQKVRELSPKHGVSPDNFARNLES